MIAPADRWAIVQQLWAEAMSLSSDSPDCPHCRMLPHADFMRETIHAPSCWVSRADKNRTRVIDVARCLLIYAEGHERRGDHVCALELRRRSALLDVAASVLGESP